MLTISHKLSCCIDFLRPRRPWFNMTSLAVAPLLGLLLLNTSTSMAGPVMLSSQFTLLNGTILNTQAFYDSDLIAPTGVSSVPLDQFLLFFTESTFQNRSLAPATIAANTVQIRFLNGLFNAYSSSGVNAVIIPNRSIGLDTIFFNVNSRMSYRFSGNGLRQYNFQPSFNVVTNLGSPPSAVSEPQALTLFGLGLAALGLMRRRKRVAA
jgi:PEP-CTERM motif